MKLGREITRLDVPVHEALRYQYADLKLSGNSADRRRYFRFVKRNAPKHDLKRHGSEVRVAPKTKQNG